LIQREDESHDPEYPSPVSVLDDAVYMDDSPSPVKHMLKTLKGQTIFSVLSSFFFCDSQEITRCGILIVNQHHIVQIVEYDFMN